MFGISLVLGPWSFGVLIIDLFPARKRRAIERTGRMARFTPWNLLAIVCSRVNCSAVFTSD
jgi:hypothetical protein